MLIALSKKLVILSAVLAFFVANLTAQWEPPNRLTKEKITEVSEELLGKADIPYDVQEDIFRINVLRMEWDVGGAVYTPKDPTRIVVGADGKKAGIFVIHGGGGDYRSKDDVARFMAGKFGYKVISFSYPGTIYLLDPSRDWPGDVVREDGSLRVPIFNKDKLITRDQYERVEDKTMRPKYGTLVMACAKENTEFYYRMAAYPMAFEEAAREMMRRHFPEDDYSVYVHGHSTGGPYAFMLTQRIQNIAGVVGMETSPFGAIYRVQARASGNPYGKTPGEVPFNCLTMFDWRMTAMYVGPQSLMIEGPEALMRLPMLMEEVYEQYAKAKRFPRFKAEGPVHFGGVRELASAARATARRMDMGEERGQQLVNHFVGYARELQGPDVKPVPPIILGMTSSSAGHEYDTYRRITLPMFAGMDPPPKIRLVPFEAGIHGYTSAEGDLPMGPFPAVGQVWHDAITKGYYADNNQRFDP